MDERLRNLLDQGIRLQGFEGRGNALLGCFSAGESVRKSTKSFLSVG